MEEGRPRFQLGFEQRQSATSFRVSSCSICGRKPGFKQDRNNEI